MLIVLLDAHTLRRDGNSWSALDRFGSIRTCERSAPVQVAERIVEADIVITNKAQVRSEAIAQAPRLRFIAVSATGYDCVDTASARQRGIPVANVPEYGTDSVAQFVFALLLHLCHRIDLHAEAVRGGEWGSCPDFSFWKTPQIELAGRRMGIVGFGRIGQRVGSIAHALGMTVLAHSRSRGPAPSYQPFAWVELEELAQQADVISLHCPLTPETGGLINRSFLGRVKPGAIVINTSRGGLIVEQDLADALASGRLAAAALDVVSREPLDSASPLLRAPNCIITPHIAWSTTAARRRLLEATVANVANFLNGQPTNIVN